MKTKVIIQLLVLLVLAHGVETQDEPDNAMTTTGDGVFLPQYQSDNIFPNTEHNPLLKNQKSSAISNNKTAGNSFCRWDQTCGFHEKQPYSFCYVDYSNRWDYCCTGECDYHGYSYLHCKTGNTWQYCGEAGTMDIDGRPCHYLHPCGMHLEAKTASTYWCYVDHRKNYGICCQPSSSCDNHGESYKWCWTGYKKETSWKYCT
ncbi:hypothetical protein ACJMK2_018278 [Sinanodonta woodiana]|uniref:Uncharacterized protein n=1 Tax=Sinanodonta woodiana TaxID=1069815 RepID=A0ABD3UFZ3_SINWO